MPDGSGFQFKDTIKEPHDLIVQHNISADNFKKAFDLGGFPMPSIVVPSDMERPSSRGLTV